MQNAFFSLCSIQDKNRFLNNFKQIYFDKLQEYRCEEQRDKYLERSREELREYIPAAVGEVTYFLKISELFKLVPIIYKQGVRDLLLKNSCCNYARREVYAAVPWHILLASKFCLWTPQL